MIRKAGKVYDAVAELLQARGIDTKGLEVAALGRGPEQLVLMDGEIIGGYNFNSRELVLYSDLGIEKA